MLRPASRSTVRFQFMSLSPTAISLIDGSTARIACAYRLKLRAYVSASEWPRTQSPQISFPTSQSFTPNGSGWPLAARIAPYFEVAGPLQYSTQAAASSTVAPRPSTFTVIEGSAPAARANATNSSVPKSLGSGSLFHERFVHVTRSSRGPTPQAQW